MSFENKNDQFNEKYAHDVPAHEPGSLAAHARGRQFSVDPEDRALVEGDQYALHRELRGRHMQMIAM